MRREDESASWTKGEAMGASALVVCAFFYFLLFAQFALLHRIEELDAKKLMLQPIMLAMGIGGIAGSVFAWKRFSTARLRGALFWGFLWCGALSLASSLMHVIEAFFVIGFGVGVALGYLTVCIVPALRLSIAPEKIGRWCGVGVGFAYAASNVPIIFNASPDDQCLYATLAVGIGACLSLGLGQSKGAIRLAANKRDVIGAKQSSGIGLWMIVGLLFALVWLDSAAFYLIQETDTLKGGTWGSDLQLWIIALAHLTSALVAGWLLERGRLIGVLLGALSLLAIGTWGVVSHGAEWALASVTLYVIGVSLYSTSLVAYAALAGASSGVWSAAKRAGIVFALAGWVASGLGIGMGRDLHTVPLAFLVIVLVAGVVMASVQKISIREKGVAA